MSYEDTHPDTAGSPPERGRLSLLKWGVGLLFMIPTLVIGALVGMNIVGQSLLTPNQICGAPFLFVLFTMSVYQSYRGLIQRDLTTTRRRTAKIQGGEAVAVGVVWVILALLFAGGAMWLLLAPLLAQ